MKRGKALMKLLVAGCVLGSLSPDFASDKLQAAGVAEQLIDLLKAKNLISADEAQRLKGEEGGADRALAELIGLLREKSVINGDEANSLSGLIKGGASPVAAAKAQEQPAPLFKARSRDEVVQRLRESWTESGQPAEECQHQPEPPRLRVQLRRPLLRVVEQARVVERHRRQVGEALDQRQARPS